MNNDALKEFAKMMAEELKKNKEKNNAPSINEQLETHVEKTNTAIEVSKYLLKPKVYKEDIEVDHNKLVASSNDNNNIPATPSNIEDQRWNDPLRPLDQQFVTKKEMNDHYGLFLQRIQQQMSTIGGGGEVNFRYLDDVNRATMSSSNDNWLLEYDAASKKVKFTNQLGPVDRINFDLAHTHDEEKVVGTVCWSPQDQTLNIEHPGGVTQQVGQEIYAYVRNGTDNIILNGTPVMFSGAEPDSGSGARLLVSPIVADGTFPSLYGLGVATQDLNPGEDGRITVWGKIREIDTSAWSIGDILYADPNSIGSLTNIKPTAPNNVVPFAAVLKVGTTDGEIFVRPTVNQMMYYGRFSRSTNFIIPNVNEAYAIPFDTTEISNGVVFNGGTDTQIIVPQSGFYQFDINSQVSATSNKGLIYFWFRKNGVDIPNSSHVSTITNGDTFNISITIQVSLEANEYVELMCARTAEGIILDARDATVFAPSTSSVTLNITQVQL